MSGQPAVKEAREAFSKAHRLGVLSDDPRSGHHAGLYVYLYSPGGEDFFKRCVARRYVSVSRWP